MHPLLRRLLSAVLVIIGLSVADAAQNQETPNVILIMVDDMGWGDVGFNGNTTIRTPHLDALCAKGARFENFFSGASVCSPSRSAFMTGRSPYRHGIWSANVGRLARQEYTIPEALKSKGYATGHFGKWHLGVPNPEYRGKGGGDGTDTHFALPQWFSYDEHFVTHHSVPTWDPYGPKAGNAATTGNPYFHNGKRVTENLLGDDTRIIMDRAIPFIQKNSEQKTPFLAVIWPHTPHEKVVAGTEYQALYPEAEGKAKHYYGTITAFDDQIGRLVEELGKLGISQNTIIAFSSDNGPEHKEGPGETGGLRGRKRSLYSGGGCVPAFMVWPGLIEPDSLIETPCSSLDYLPTLVDYLSIERPDQRPLDGASLLPILKQETSKRPTEFPFLSKGKLAWIGNEYKLITQMKDERVNASDELYNIRNDRFETTNIAAQNPELLKSIKLNARRFMRSAKSSFQGGDYDDPNYTPLGNWLESKKNKKK
ncbi:sulfatase-like hydrolase/transferase [Pelagicoccus mobilis]|uniref:Sulfatase-like hydrolase/transferase n=1 Tax=Pelagicoccus mobilis TaxID=415221 RepID=A0A934RX91_9BACT|nr:sulfatase-like hydrolase/transferase [Pelagicoccus mobilis]MBK1876057.1 sulfatase-like hydrolase/transferase [Pelagicoccus mobilis]